ncbi:hypothetical protein [Chryseotalea sanaruensis]|nr:hypothetical protein [Chryseotalea sanaruensis]
MKDSARVSTEIKTISDNLLIVKEGALSLNLIAVVQFQTQDKKVVDLALIENLLKENIVVYIGQEKFVKEKEAISTPDTTRQSITQVVNPALVNKPLEPTIQKSEAESEEDGTITEDYNEINDVSLHLGLGLGLDYGGVGGRLTFIPGDAEKTSVGIFVAAGYALNGLGFNAGLNLRLGQQRLVPTISAMYGYNGVIKVIGASQYDKTYYGPSVAVGFENKTRNSDDNYIHLELVIPFRSASFQNDIKALQNNPGIDISAPSPVLVSIGYHFKI